ncbi:MAG TPA: class II fumarate hydratase [Acidimicrobiia bacterium]|nr:class II fumarate hydratase [Acidimicrobiia bacterium]
MSITGAVVEYRVEKDSMGEVHVPANAYYGASTQRAVDNFPISGLVMDRRIIWAFGLLKGSAAAVSERRGEIPVDVAEAVRRASDAVMDGAHDDQFPVDIFQTGSGTSTNTNANEVIANLASEILGGERGSRLVHPNDHVNFGQSSNDTFPTAMHLAAVHAVRTDLLPGLTRLAESLESKAHDFEDVVKSGRTHLMDAVPVTLGQEFGGYATQVRKSVDRIERVLPDLEELALGGTAVGTGINAPDGWAAEVIADMASRTGYDFREADNHFEAQGSKDGVVSASGVLKTVAQSLFKIANDLRWLSSGPVTGIAEIRLPSLQPGSSIMPAKVNPVIPEMVMQVAAQVVGNDTAITWGGANGNFELNVMMPMMARNLLEAISLLGAASANLASKCVDGIEADADRARELLEKNVIVVTALNPHIGYDAGSRVAKRAFAEGRSVRDVVLEEGLMGEAELDAALDLKGMTQGGVQ